MIGQRRTLGRVRNRQMLVEATEMRLPNAWLSGVSLFVALVPAARADNVAVEPRHFLSDGTVPAVSKGRESKVKLEVQAASLESPVAALIIPRMPHGFLDPTHPVGAAEPGSAAPMKVAKPRMGPVSSGLVLMPIRRAP